MDNELPKSPHKRTTPLRMANLMVFLKAVGLGFVGAEVFRLSFYLGGASWLSIAQFGLEVFVCVATFCVAFWMTASVVYAHHRQACQSMAKVWQSGRWDLLFFTFVGIEVNFLVEPSLTNLHQAFKGADPFWSLALGWFFIFSIASTWIRTWGKRKKTTNDDTAMVFLFTDTEVSTEEDDLFHSKERVEAFAKTVLASSAQSGLVFGIDGPWGVGKTSFINLVQKEWEKDKDSRVIVCRFEPLRYASDPDISERLIHEIAAAIRKKVFAPEVQANTSRYARLLKGVKGFSALGVNISLPQPSEMLDELLEDIDQSLKQLGYRVIVVIDDLDRLDTATVDRVLFATRRTFKLSQATYVLCYATDNLLAKKEGEGKAREFLEKFVTVRYNLFIEVDQVQAFLTDGWKRRLSESPDVIKQLDPVLAELARLLKKDRTDQIRDLADRSVDRSSHHYLALAGDLRKVKRFVNALLMTQIKKADLSLTDFNKTDLINLLLLYLNYPEIFREILATETNGRRGTFSVQQDQVKNDQTYENSDAFNKRINADNAPQNFLLRQLFDVETLRIGANNHTLGPEFRVSRACINDRSNNTLELYLRFIVHQEILAPQDTFTLYEDAMDRLRNGQSIQDVLKLPSFSFQYGDRAQAKLWGKLIYGLNGFALDFRLNAKETLVSSLPRFNSIRQLSGPGTRQVLVLYLVELLNAFGNTPKNEPSIDGRTSTLTYISDQIFGDRLHSEPGVLRQLVNTERGILGWFDLMKFRQICLSDSSLSLNYLHETFRFRNENGAGQSRDLSRSAAGEMRNLSQEIFALFKSAYIDSKTNFFAKVSQVRDDEILGDAMDYYRATEHNLGHYLAATRSGISEYVVFQLSNTLVGVGCGFFDEVGDQNNQGIATAMAEYVFETCFNPVIDPDNIFYFLDFCLTNLTSGFYTGRYDRGWTFTRKYLAGPFELTRMRQYWSEHRHLVKQRNLIDHERTVTTGNYIATYRDYLPRVVEFLDGLVDNPIVALAPPESAG